MTKKLLARARNWLFPTRCVECGASVSGDSLGYVLGKRCLLHYYRWTRN